MLSPAQRRIKPEGAGMGKAVQYPLTSGNPGYSGAVILLVQEKAGFLPVFHIYQVSYPVFAYLCYGGFRRRYVIGPVPTLTIR